jgi:hypothetical protein
MTRFALGSNIVTGRQASVVFTAIGKYSTYHLSLADSTGRPNHLGRGNVLDLDKVTVAPETAA